MPVITISREFGAGGKTLGERLAGRLGYPFYDNDIIQMVAKKAKVSPEWAEIVEKGKGGKLPNFISSLVPKRLIDRILVDMEGHMDEEIYIDLLDGIITNIADQGNAIILGRGSQYILYDREDTYHVLLIADIADRIAFMEKNYDLLPTQARIAVENEDKRRMNLYRKFKRKDFDQPQRYHMVLNMSKLTMEDTIELIAKMVGA